MDTVTRFSACLPCTTTNMTESVFALQTVWLNQFWPPQHIHGDQAFYAQEFQNFLKLYDIGFRSVPSRRHSKNPLEPKHGVIRSIYIRLKSSAKKNKLILSDELLAMQAVSISNDLYGSDTLSSFEMTKGFTKPLSSNNQPIPVPEDVIAAHETLKAKRKLNLILRSHKFETPHISVGDQVQIFVKNDQGKFGKWLSARPVIKIDVNAGSVTVPGSKGHTITAAFEDTRHAIIDDDLAELVQTAIDDIDSQLDEIISSESISEDIATNLSLIHI